VADGDSAQIPPGRAADEREPGPPQGQGEQAVRIEEIDGRPFAAIDQVLNGEVRAPVEKQEVLQTGDRGELERGEGEHRERQREAQPQGEARARAMAAPKDVVEATGPGEKRVPGT
jgi:hypothetical protein